MPNWCFNSIEINGEPKKMKRLIAVIDAARKKGSERFFESVIGVEDHTTPEELESGGWYNHNVCRFGTKWDIGFEQIEVDGDSVFINEETAWSPPVEAMKHLSTIYGVNVQMYYEEPGADFCGKTTILSDGTTDEEDYTYQGGIYKFEGFYEWWDREFEHNTEWIIDEFNDLPESNKSAEQKMTELVEESFDFLKENEVKEVVEHLLKEVKEVTES